MSTKLFISLLLFLTLLLRIEASTISATAGTVPTMTMTFANPGPSSFMNTCPGAFGKACLEWADTQGYPAENYLLTISWINPTTGNEVFKVFDIAGNIGSIMINNLTAGMTYNFVLQACRFGVYSSEAGLTVMTPPETPCQNKALGISDFNCVSESSGKGEVNVVCSWTNGAVAYTNIIVDIACDYTVFKKGGKKKQTKHKIFRNERISVQGVDTVVLLKNIKMDTCGVLQRPNNPQVNYVNCCVGCAHEGRFQDGDM